ncbi:response regulator [Roseixanthobacter pseudopolyaromaticivorans]|uniref:response regulator n=1 Tax=Xanthobacteraceae TaxID=335928 RepID=UPI00372A725F
MSRRRTLLICDDEPELAEELGEFFTAAGWHVRTCHSAPDALTVLLEGYHPICLITDLRVGEHDGAELVAAARLLPKDLQPQVVVIITGHIINEAEAADFDADLLYVKPLDPILMVDQIEAVLAQAASATSL